MDSVDSIMFDNYNDYVYLEISNGTIDSVPIDNHINIFPDLRIRYVCNKHLYDYYAHPIEVAKLFQELSYYYKYSAIPITHLHTWYDGKFICNATGR